MPVSQSRLLICLLASSLVSTTGLADSVIVNTTVDENNIDNQSCSLREAVNYLNAKNTKKALIDEEVAVISGTSRTLLLQIVDLSDALALEEQKIPNDTIRIAALEKDIELSVSLYNNGISQLKNKISDINALIDEEKVKVTPDAALIKSHENTITNLETQITSQEKLQKEKEKELEDYRATGLFGCKTDSASTGDIAYLADSDKPYELLKSLTLNLSIQISPQSTADNINSNEDLLPSVETKNIEHPRIVIQAIGQHPLFIVDDGSVTSSINVSISSIDLVGCKLDFCAVNGGLILNKDTLAINNAILSNGYAQNFGGAIYNAFSAVTTANQVLFKENKAFSGAAIYSEANNISIVNSLFTKNTAFTSESIVNVANQSASITSNISNSTFSSNTGYAIASRDNLVLNNNTIVLNTGGVNFNYEAPRVYNSIIAGNTINGDCKNMINGPDATKIYFANNVFMSGCLLGSSAVQNKQISGTGQELLIADTNNDGICDAPPANGLLCPLAENGGPTQTHKPRMLMAYLLSTDSPIINKGYNNTDTNKGLNCLSVDQRGKSRSDRCDIGALEVQTEYTNRDGVDILFGETPSFSLAKYIGDGELVPQSACNSIFGINNTRDKSDGCFGLIIAPTKGIVSINNSTHELVYSPNGTFHGLERFAYGVSTTISRFSDASNDRVVRTDLRINSEPNTQTASKALDNGSSSFFSLLILSLLGFCRRLR